MAPASREDATKWAYPSYKDEGTTLDDLRKAVTMLEETERAARRVLGGAHPDTKAIREDFCDALAALRARETGDA